jgi:hypothetical protein
MDRCNFIKATGGGVAGRLSAAPGIDAIAIQAHLTVLSVFGRPMGEPFRAA